MMVLHFCNPYIVDFLKSLAVFTDFKYKNNIIYIL